MVKNTSAAWALAHTAITFGITLTTALAQPQSGLHFTPQEVAVWRTRSTAGPYKTLGDAGANTPADWTRIAGFADEFRASPADSGNTSATNLDIWTGYRYQIDSLGQYPVWQGIKMEAAAFRYLLSGDTSYGGPVRRTLLQQVRFSHPIHKGYNVATWPTPASVNTNPSYEAGAKECLWLSRLLFSYDYTRNLYTTAEQAEINAYLQGAAWYFARRAHNNFKQNFPLRLTNNYTQKIYMASPNGVPQWNPPVYAPAQYARHQVWGDGFVYTHRNADGSLGNKLSRLAFWYNNRTFEKNHFIGLCGLGTGDTLLVRYAKQTVKEWIMFSVYPDGTYGEYERNGDYVNMMQGSMLYGSLNVQSVVMLADALARKGDLELYNFSTTDGVHGSQVPNGGVPKSIRTVIDRYAKNCAAQQPIYYNSTASANRQDTQNDVTSTYGTDHVTWDYLLAVANKFYQDNTIKSTYMRSRTGTIPYPANGYTSAGKVWVPWSGTGAEYPGYLFMFGQMESVPTIPRPCAAPGTPAANNVSTTTATLLWSGNAANYRVRYRPAAGGVWTYVASTDSSLDVAGLAPATAYQTQVSGLCSALDSSAYGGLVTFTTQAQICPVPQGLSAGSVTTTSAQLTATAVAGAVNYIAEYRVAGASAWTALPGQGLPIDIGGLASATAYEARIATVCTFGVGVASGTISFTTLAPPCTQVGGLVGTPQGTGSDTALLRWGASANATAYQVRLKKTTSANWKFIFINTPTHKEGALEAGATYEFQVAATCPGGQNSGFTPSSNFVMPLPPCPVPDAPTVSAITQTGASISVANAQGNSWEVRYHVLGSTAYTTVAVSAWPVQLAGLALSTNYGVQARAICTGNQSVFGAEATFATPGAPPPPPCDTATAIAAANVSDATAGLSWSGGAARYQIGYKPVAAASFSTVTVDGNALSLTGLAPGTTYQVQIVSLCGAATSGVAHATFITRRSATAVSQVFVQRSFSIAPNPADLATGAYILTNETKGLTESGATITLYDAAGKLLARADDAFADGRSANLAQLAPAASGLVLVHVRTRTGQAWQGRVVFGE